MSKTFSLKKGTFRVQGHNFVLQSRKNITIFNNSAEMWDKKINWESIKSQFKTRGGSSNGAMTIQNGLNILATSPLEDLTADEQTMIQDILTSIRTSREDSFMTFYGKGIQGKPFEERIGLLVSKIFDNSSLDDILYGTRQTSAGAAIGSLTLDTKNLKDKSQLHQLVSEDIGEIYQKLVKHTTEEIISGFGTKKTKVILRQSTRQGKIDIKVPTNLKITTNLTPEVRNMAEEMRGHTFSLKNYKLETLIRGGAKLGKTTLFRALSSFYYGATKDANFTNTCTFYYASIKSSDSNVSRYISWARYIFELTGLGLYDMSAGNVAEPVDYLIVNARNVEGGIQVLWSGDLIINAPEGSPEDIAFTKSGGIHILATKIF